MRIFLKTLRFVAVIGVLTVLGVLDAQSAPFKVPVSGQPDHAAYLTHLVMKNGWDKELGFEMELIYFDSGMAQIEALPAKQWVVGTMTSVPWLVGALRYDLYAAGLANDDTHSNLVLVRPDSPILKAKGVNPNFPETYGSAETVRGKTVLTTTVSSAHYALAVWLERLGLTEKDVIVKNMDQAQALAAFESGIGDIVVLWAPTMFVGLDKGWKCANLDSQKGASLPSVIAMDRTWADTNPEKAALVLKAYFKAIDYLKKENVALAQDFSQWLLEWAGIEMAPQYAAIDIKNHTVWTLPEQLVLMNESKGPSEVQKWTFQLSDFFVSQGRFKPGELTHEQIRKCITDAFLKRVQ